MPDGIIATETATSKLRIGLIVDSPSASKYVFDLVEWSQLQSDISISHLIIQDGLVSQKGKIGKIISLLRRYGFLKILRQLSFKVLTDLESLILKRSNVHADHLGSFDLTRFAMSSLHVEPIVSKSGFLFRYRDDDIRAIERLNFDILLRCGSGILRGKILSASRFGVISFHHGDNRINRGGPAGFWEVYFQQESTGFVIQQLTEELDGGNVLFRGCFATKYYYLLNQASVCQRSNFYLKEFLKRVARDGKFPDAEASRPYFNPLFKTPNLAQQLYYFVRLLPRIAKNLWDKISGGNRYRWGVAYVKGDWKSLVMWRGRRIMNPPHRFLADPFVIREDNTDYCFVEDCDLRIGRGCISVYRLGDDGAERLGEAIVEPFHMSFPFLFRFNSKIYMCPETCEAKEIRLYESVTFPFEWKLTRVIMANISAVDTMIFEFGGLWWLFTNVEPVAGGDYCSQLSIFYVDNPLSERWTPHPKNPIFVDSTRARNGGVVFDNGSVYRVSQKQGFNMYGKGFSINKISKLTKTEYEEENICPVEPNFFARISAAHHLHSNGHVTVFDAFGPAGPSG